VYEDVYNKSEPRDSNLLFYCKRITEDFTSTQCCSFQLSGTGLCSEGPWIESIGCILGFCYSTFCSNIQTSVGILQYHRRRDWPETSFLPAPVCNHRKFFEWQLLWYPNSTFDTIATNTY